jgi:hypothetical protein
MMPATVRGFEGFGFLAFIYFTLIAYELSFFDKIVQAHTFHDSKIIFAVLQALDQNTSAPCVTALLNRASLSLGLFCPVRSRNPYTATVIGGPSKERQLIPEILFGCDLDRLFLCQFHVYGSTTW